MQTKTIICKALIDYADKNSTVIPVIAVKAYYLFERIFCNYLNVSYNVE